MSAPHTKFSDPNVGITCSVRPVSPSSGDALCELPSESRRVSTIA